MRTPALRRPLSRGVLLAVAAVFIAFNAFVYLVVKVGLDNAVNDVLETRATVAAEIAPGAEPAELAEQLTALGIPAAVHAPDGQTHASEPIIPRGGVAPPAPGGVLDPAVSRRVDVGDGTVVEVFATRAGVERALRLLLATAAGGTILALWLTHLLVRRFVDRSLDPLGQVAATAERIASGSAGERLQPDEPETELGRMAVAFDDMVAALEDAVARAETEEERTRRFLADAAHQLRTPITGIRAAVELMLQENDPELRDQLMAHTIRETVRTTRLITSLLHIARLDKARPPSLEATDLAALCADEIERAQGLAPHLDFDVDVSAAPADPVAVDPGEIREAVANLVDNACRHATSRIDVRVAQANGDVEIRLSDDGAGVRQGTERLIFERFASLDGMGGSGLGLSIARGVARAHGGDLTYEDGDFVLRVPLGGRPDDESARVVTVPDLVDS